MQRINWKFAVTLIAITSFHGFSSIWPSGEEGPATPALPTRMSSLPWRSCSAAPSRAMPSKSVRLSGTSVALPPSLRISSSSSSRPPCGARDRDDMRAGLGQRARGGIADAARGAGDESDAGGEGKGHGCSYFVVVPARRGHHIVVQGYETMDALVTSPSHDDRDYGSRVRARSRHDAVRVSSLPPAATIAAAAARPGSGR